MLLVALMTALSQKWHNRLYTVSASATAFRSICALTELIHASMSQVLSMRLHVMYSM